MKQRHSCDELGRGKVIETVLGCPVHPGCAIRKDGVNLKCSWGARDSRDYQVDPGVPGISGLAACRHRLHRCRSISLT